MLSWGKERGRGRCVGAEAEGGKGRPSALRPCRIRGKEGGIGCASGAKKLYHDEGRGAGRMLEDTLSNERLWVLQYSPATPRLLHAQLPFPVARQVLLQRSLCDSLCSLLLVSRHTVHSVRFHKGVALARARSSKLAAPALAVLQLHIPCARVASPVLDNGLCPRASNFCRVKTRHMTLAVLVRPRIIAPCG